MIAPDSVTSGASRPEPQQAASGSRERKPIVCTVCERPVEPGIGKTPREKHPACRRFAYYLAAALRALEEIDFPPLVRSRARGDLIGAANRIPVDWKRPRDARGRFSRGSEPVVLEREVGHEALTAHLGSNAGGAPPPASPGALEGQS